MIEIDLNPLPPDAPSRTFEQADDGTWVRGDTAQTDSNPQS